MATTSNTEDDALAAFRAGARNWLEANIPGHAAPLHCGCSSQNSINLFLGVSCVVKRNEKILRF